MPLLAEECSVLSDKIITKYIQTQFKKLKKHKTNINSDDTFKMLITELQLSYNIKIINNTLFAIQLDNESDYSMVKDNIRNVISMYYDNIDMNLLFKFTLINGSLIVKKKMIT